MILYITGAIFNVLFLLIFRSVFTDTQERKRMFAWICSTSAVLSFILWIAILIVIIIECFKYLNNKKNDKKEKQCYDKAINILRDVFMMLCNTNGPLPSVDEQGKVIRIIQDTKDKINKLIEKKL